MRNKVIDLPDLPGDPDVSTDEARAAWTIEDDSQAIWAMRKVAAIRLRYDEVDECYDRELYRIGCYHAAEIAKGANDLEFFTQHLEAYALRERGRKDGRDRKTIALGGVGEVKTREFAAKIVIDDPDAFQVWALNSAPHLLRNHFSPNLIELATECRMDESGAVVMLATGEVVPGAVIAPCVVRATVKEAS